MHGLNLKEPPVEIVERSQNGWKFYTIVIVISNHDGGAEVDTSRKGSPISFRR